MVDETTIAAEAGTEAPAKVTEAVAGTVGPVAIEAANVEPVAATAAKTAKIEKAARRAGQPLARRLKAKASDAKPAARRSTRKNLKAVRKTPAAASKRNKTMTNTNVFAGFDAVPAFAPFQSLVTEANERGQELAKKSQKVAEELADLARANVEAVVEASRVATEGARAIGQDAVSSGRASFEQAADAIRTLAEAKSPTEYLQLQGDFARASFDRAVAESSRLTESLVKLAGEAFQPISNRASANAERINTFVA